jgi:hypothetical protein
MTAESRARRRLARLSPSRRAHVRQALGDFLAAADVASTPSDDELALVSSALADRAADRLWLISTLVHARMPRPAVLRHLARIAELDGPWAVLDEIVSTAPRRLAPVPTVRSGILVIDVGELLVGDLPVYGRGVARALARALPTTVPHAVLVRPDAARLGFQLLSTEECEHLGLAPTATPVQAIVPIRSKYLLVGFATYPERAERLIGMAQSSGNATASVGYGLAQLLHPGDFARSRSDSRRPSWHLAAQRSFDVLCVVGDGARAQYEGWAKTLPAIGVRAPVMHTVVADVPEPNDYSLAPEVWSEVAATVVDALDFHHAE